MLEPHCRPNGRGWEALQFRLNALFMSAARRIRILVLGRAVPGGELRDVSILAPTVVCLLWRARLFGLLPESRVASIWLR